MLLIFFNMEGIISSFSQIIDILCDFLTILPSLMGFVSEVVKFVLSPDTLVYALLGAFLTGILKLMDKFLDF